MNQRLIFRWIHIIVSIPIYGYIYSPLKGCRSTPTLLGLSSFLSWSLQDC